MGSGSIILLDTHIWIWWVNESSRLQIQHKELIDSHESDQIFVSAISCWEIAKLVEKGKLNLDRLVTDWLEIAILKYRVGILPLFPKISVESTRLPGEFHKDPADQIIVATSRVHDIPLLTYDNRILSYPHLKAIK